MRVKNVVTTLLTRPDGTTVAGAYTNVRTNAGALYISQLQGSSSNAPAAYIACSNLAFVPSMGDTSLPGEITLFNLSRQLGAYGGYVAPGYLDGPAAYVLTTTFIASGPAVVLSLGCFTALTGGVLMAELTIAPQNLVAASSFTVNWTFNI